MERKYWHGPILKATVNERTIGLDKWAGVVGLSRPRKSSICPSDRRTMTLCWPVSSIVKRLSQFLTLICWKRESNIRRKGLELWKALKSKKQKNLTTNLFSSYFPQKLNCVLCLIVFSICPCIVFEGAKQTLRMTNQSRSQSMPNKTKAPIVQSLSLTIRPSMEYLHQHPTMSQGLT